MTEVHDSRDTWKTFRYCPACGARGIPAHAGRSVLCRQCGFHFFFNVASAVAGIIEDDMGRLLMTVRAHDPKKGSLDLPGGFVDIAETAEDALKREIREELNLEVKVCSYFSSFPNVYTYDGLTYRTLDLCFICTVESFSAQRLSDEIKDVRFMRCSEVDLSDIAFDSIRRCVSLYLEENKGIRRCQPKDRT